jgi:hypothetical protein
MKATSKKIAALNESYDVLKAFERETITRKKKIESSSLKWEGFNETVRPALDLSNA